MVDWSMAYETSPDGHHHVIALTGELDVTTVGALRWLLRGLHGDVELDCTHVDFVDSAGMGLLVSSHRAAQGRGDRLGLRNLPSPSYRALDVAGLTRLLDVEPLRTAKVSSASDAQPRDGRSPQQTPTGLGWSLPSDAARSRPEPTSTEPLRMPTYSTALVRDSTFGV